ncbi:alcohol dehydrogenase catalytic domain-containing protein [Thermaurantiacus sp.]
MPRTVRAAVAFAPNTPLEVREVTLADPGPGQVLVRFLATGLCHSDLHVLDGSLAHPFPVVCGHEAIADVVEVGEGVPDFAPGDRVIPFLVPDCGQCPFCRSGRTNFCLAFAERQDPTQSPFSIDGVPLARFMAIGSFAEMAVIAADQLTKVSRAAEPAQACCIGCGVTTGIGAAERSAGVTAGSSVAVFGVGGVGLSVVIGARLRQAATIIAIDRNPRRRAVAEKAGATHFIDASAEPDTVAAVLALTGGLGVDFSFECVGIPALATQALAATNPAWGVSVCVGVMPTGSQLSCEPNQLLIGRRWTGSFMGGAKRADVARYVEQFVRGEFDLDDTVSHRLSLDEINRGFAMMKSGEAVRSVVVF